MQVLGAKYGNNVGFYHYEYEVLRNENGELNIINQRKLATGIADAQSIDVAEMLGAPSDFVDKARAFMDESLQLSERSTIDLALRNLAEDTSLDGLYSLFPLSCDDTRFFLYSRDPDFAKSAIRDIHRPR